MRQFFDVLFALLESAKILGLEERDISNAKDLLHHNEFGLCFDTILTQLYEYDIEIDDEFYALIIKIGKAMSLPTENYSFMKELIRSDTDVPKPVKDRLSQLMTDLEQNSK